MVLNFYKWFQSKGRFKGACRKKKKRNDLGWYTGRTHYVKYQLPGACLIIRKDQKPKATNFCAGSLQKDQQDIQKPETAFSRGLRGHLAPPSPLDSGSQFFSFLLWTHESGTTSQATLWIFSSVTLHNPISKFYIFLFSFFPSFVLKFWKKKKPYTLSIWCPSWRLAKSPAP